jgi:replicative DNA helicase
LVNFEKTFVVKFILKAEQDIHRSPPFSVEFEQALLGGCIVDGGQNSIALCIQEKITPDAFYLPAHALIYRTLLELYNTNTPLNELIVAEKLQSHGDLEKVGGYDYINTISNCIDTPIHLKHYIDRIRDLDLIRRVIDVANKSIENAYAGIDNVGQFLDDVEQSIFSIAENRIADTIEHIRNPINAAVNMFQRLMQNRGKITGIASGFIDLDRLTLGLHSGEMIVVAARPSMGKTSFALNIAENVVAPRSSTPIPTLFFSLEMSSEQLAMRLLCSRSGIDMRKLREGFVHKSVSATLNTTANELKKIPLWIDESSGISVSEVRAKARRMYNKHKLGLIIIDYLQLLATSDSRTPREQQIAEISRGIKAMAKELNLPVIVLSQLNRESERDKRQPKLSDLRESGAIEQDADTVLLLSKPRSNERDDDKNQETGCDLVDRELIIAKQRNGPTGNVLLKFNKSLTRFENYAQENKV